MPFFLLLIVLSVSQLWSGTTGKIAGIVTDKANGEPIIGANIVILGTSLGAASDLNGQYSILSIPPGTYQIKISSIGYETIIVSNVRVYIDQTARVDVALNQQTINTDEVIIIAERNTVKPDVATSVVAVSKEEIVALPVANVTDVMGMQAGIDNNHIRGVGLDQALFMVDGVTMRDPRNNQAITKVAMSSVQEISVERGGFNAEYGQVQSGLVNVVTSEGKVKGYTGSINLRMSPPARKYFHGPDMPDPTDQNSYWLRSFYDPAVCWTGTTNGVWDKYTKQKYLEFQGWNAVSEGLCTDPDPTNDLTPLGAQRAFEYETRKKAITDQPDYEIDAGFGGPVPFISEPLGNLRFFASYRGQRTMLLFPTTRPDYKDYDARLVLNSDISNSIKLRVSALQGNISKLAGNATYENAYYQYPNDFAGAGLGTGGYAQQNIFGNWAFSLTDIQHNSLSTKFTHWVSKKTYYEISVDYLKRHYDTRPPAMRDTSQKYQILPGFSETSTPNGVFYGIDGIIVNEGNQNALARDKSTVSSITAKADFFSEIFFNNQIKSGIEFVYNDLDLNYGFIKMQTGGLQYANHVIMHNYPVRAAGYIQDKYETKGFVINAGLRIDYSDSRTEWWTLDPFNQNFNLGSKFSDTLIFAMTKPKGQWQISPRLGISHPITENSKLYFNYGHFKQMPQYEAAYRYDRADDNSITRLGNPNLILAKTIAYELGYDHQLFDGQLLVQISVFYRDISDQQNTTTYTPTSGSAYTVTTSTSYSDIRGFELTLRKTTGRWFYGFLNYTYQATSNGNFGENYIYEDPLRQLAYDENTANTYQTRSIPTPFARANLNFSTPQDFGPTWAGQNILGDFMVNLLLRWTQGGWTTYNPNNAGTTGVNNTNNKIQNNVQFVDYFDASLRASKSITIKPFTIQIFADISNLFNLRRLNNTGDLDYRKSLHLPKSIAYNNIPGNDKFGDYREPGVAWQPIENGNPSNNANDPAWFYVDGKYYYALKDANGNPVEVEGAKVKQALDNKAYINMPNPSTFWFLNPRNITYGLRVSFDLD
jgi:outer membrane receptor protein involved in Fe transport